MFGSELLREFYARTKIVARKRRCQFSRAFGEKAPPLSGFFDDYPLFYATSKTDASPNRLNQRHRACIEWNSGAIAGKRILDLASHDGRWSFAAMKAGAKSVYGIEGRDYLVHNSIDTFNHYAVPKDSFRFVAGDVFEEIAKVEPGTIDTVFCFGFFYHQGHHTHLLDEIARLKPQFVVLDTALHLDPYPIVFFFKEPPVGEANAAPVGLTANKAFQVSGAPSRSALDMMLEHFGWKFEYYDWQNAGIKNWDNIADYHEGWRVTVRADCRQSG